MFLTLKKRSRTDAIVVHCAATRPSQNIGVEEIDRWHRIRGFLTIGYHKVIRRDGTVEDGREIEAIGAHARGWNGRSVGVCLVGGVAENDPRRAEKNFTEAQMAALGALLDDLRARYPEAEILGHRDLPDVAKDCPSFDVRRWLRQRDATAQTASPTPAASAASEPEAAAAPTTEAPGDELVEAENLAELAGAASGVAPAVAPSSDTLASSEAANETASSEATT